MSIQTILPTISGDAGNSLTKGSDGGIYAPSVQGLPIAKIRIDQRYGLRIRVEGDESVLPAGLHPAQPYEFETRDVLPVPTAFSSDQIGLSSTFDKLFSSSGTKEIRITVQDINGVKDSTTISITVSRVLEVNSPNEDVNSYISKLSDALDYIRPNPVNPTPIGGGIGSRSEDAPWVVKVYGKVDEGSTTALCFKYIHIIVMPDSTIRFGDGTLIMQSRTSLTGHGWDVPGVIKDSGSNPNGILQATVSSSFNTEDVHINNIWIVNEINGDDELPNIVGEATALNVSTPDPGPRVDLINVRTTSRAINTFRNASMSASGKIYSRGCLFETVGDFNGARLINGGGLTDHGSVMISDTASVTPLSATIRQGAWEFHDTHIIVKSDHTALETRGSGPLRLYNCTIDISDASAGRSAVFATQVTSFTDWELFNNTLIHGGIGTGGILVSVGGPWLSARFIGNIVNGNITGLTPVVATRDIGGNEQW